MNPNDELNRYANRVSDADKENVRNNLCGMNRGPIAQVWHNVQALWRMVRDPAAPTGAKIAAWGALAYLVLPFDLVADPIPYFGLLDDAAVIAAVVTKLASDLKRYQD